jgi:hypothetical protein
MVDQAMRQVEVRREFRRCATREQTQGVTAQR